MLALFFFSLGLVAVRNRDPAQPSPVVIPGKFPAVYSTPFYVNAAQRCLHKRVTRELQEQLLQPIKKPQETSRLYQRSKRIYDKKNCRGNLRAHGAGDFVRLLPAQRCPLIDEHQPGCAVGFPALTEEIPGLLEHARPRSPSQPEG